MTLDVVYSTYWKDLSWICYSMQLLHKHFRAAFGVHVLAEEDCKQVTDTWGLPRTTYHFTKPWKDGYAFAMYQKAIADTYSQADLVLLMDSDHMLMEPVYLEDLLSHAKPIIRFRDWDEDPNDPALLVGKAQWGPPTARCLGIPLDRDYMVGPPFMFWRDTFAKMRQRVEDVIGLPFHDAVYSDRPYDYKQFLSHPKVFCDYEALGLYAAKFEPERYNLQHHPRGSHWPWRVYWSHGDWTPALRAKLDELLAK